MLQPKGLETLGAASFVKRLLEDCHQGLASLLPFTATKMEFLARLLTRGGITP